MFPPRGRQLASDDGFTVVGVVATLADVDFDSARRSGASNIPRRCSWINISISSRAAKSRRRYTSVRLTPANMMNRVATSFGNSNVTAKPCSSSSLHMLRAAMLRAAREAWCECARRPQPRVGEHVQCHGCGSRGCSSDGGAAAHKLANVTRQTIAKAPVPTRQKTAAKQMQVKTVW